MSQLTENKNLVRDFIETIWNKNNFSELDNFLAPNYTDLSLPAAFPSNKEGLTKWIIGTSAAFEHHTTVENIVAEDDQVVVIISMTVKHIGPWRGIVPEGRTATTRGYRSYTIHAGKILKHNGMIDGHALEQQLKKELN